MGHCMIGHMFKRIGYARNEFIIFYVTIQPNEDADYNFSASTVLDIWNIWVAYSVANLAFYFSLEHLGETVST